MPDISTGSQVPRLPRHRETRYGVPLQGTTLQSAANLTNHLAVWRFLRSIHHIIDYDADLGALSSRAPGASTSLVRTLWRVSARATHVWLHCRHQADVGSLSSPPAIAVSVTKTDGTVVDEGFTWDEHALQVGQVATLDDDGSVASVWPLRSIWTTFRAAVPTEGARPPDCLSLGHNAGELLEVRLQCTAVRVVSVDLWELHRSPQPVTLST